MVIPGNVNELHQQISDLRAGFEAATAVIVMLGDANEELRLQNEALKQRLLDEWLYKAQMVDVIEGK